MTTTLAVPRLELWSGLGCKTGAARLSTGGFVRSWTGAEFTKSEDNEESLTYTIPLSEEAASYVQEGQVTRVWWNDTRYDEWLVRKVAKKRTGGGKVNVSCGPVTYYLAEHGYVPDIVTSTTGQPLLEPGIKNTTLSDLFTNYLVNNAKVNAVLPWLAVGSIPSPFSTARFDLSWSFASAQAVINAAVNAAQVAAGQPAIWRLVRNGSTSYDITIFAAA